MSSLHKAVTTKNMPPPSSTAASNKSHSRKRDYSPLPWSDFFDERKDVPVGCNTFRVYIKGSTGPVIMLLHGGGHSGLSWACFTVELSKLTECSIVAVDMRGHGDTITNEDENLSVDRLVQDINDLFNAMYGGYDIAPPTILMGHSMGGAIAIRVAAAKGIPSLVGVAVIDIVEGTAMDSLTGMQSFLRSRPQTFKSLEYAIEWSIRSGQLRNKTSARVSMQGQVVRRVDSGVQEKGEQPKSATSLEVNTPTDYKWRVDLSKTEVYWRGWFEGLSKLFLTCTSEPKILILAGVDRLDKELTIGQMQGKFQMIVLKGCGHAVHEDSPERVAEIVAGFLIRYKLSQQKESFQSTFPSC